MNQSPDVPEITPQELKDRLDAGDVPVLVDVREYHEAEIADLPQHDQLRIPTGEFPQRMDEVSPDADVVLYCRSGGRSAWATAILADARFKYAKAITQLVLFIIGLIVQCRLTRKRCAYGDKKRI